MYAVRHVNLMDTHIPPKKNANQARIVDIAEVLGLSSVERNSFVVADKVRVQRIKLKI